MPHPNAYQLTPWTRERTLIILHYQYVGVISLAFILILQLIWILFFLFYFIAQEDLMTLLSALVMIFSFYGYVKGKSSCLCSLISLHQHDITKLFFFFLWNCKVKVCLVGDLFLSSFSSNVTMNNTTHARVADWDRGLRVGN